MTEAADNGFAYTNAFCEAIESYTKDKEALDNKAFYYRGAYLKFLVERYLFIAFVNSARLRTLFQQKLDGSIPASIETGDKVERDIAAHLCGYGRPNEYMQDRYRVASSALTHFFRILHYARDGWRDTLSYMPPRSSYRQSGRPDVAVCVAHKKFVRYLMPVMKRLDLPYVYLTDPGEGQEYFLREHNIPFLYFKRRRKCSFPNNALADFRDLLGLYDRIYATFKELRPRCALLAEGNSPLDEAVNRACQELAIPTVCLQHGWSPVVFTYFKNMSFTKLLMWGEGFKELFQPYSPKEKIIPVGNHVVGTCPEKAKRNRNAVSFFLQVTSQIISEVNWYRLVELAQWTAHEFKEIPVIVREHPSYPLPLAIRTALSRFSNIILMPPDDYSLDDVLCRSKVAVAILSSVIFEAIAAGVFPVVVNETSLPSCLPGIRLDGAGIEVRSIDDAREVIRQIFLKDNYLSGIEQNMKRFTANYFTSTGEDALGRIAGEIQGLIVRNGLV